MSLFDGDLVRKPCFSGNGFLTLKKNTFLGDLLNTVGAKICWISKSDVLDDLLSPFIRDEDKSLFSGHKYSIINKLSCDNDCLTVPPILQCQMGRPIITLDCSQLRKGDALGFMYSLSQIQQEPNPIVIINRITDIPRVGSNIDEPAYVENLLLHSWHNDVFSLMDHTGTPYTINMSSLSVIIPIVRHEISPLNLARLRGDGFAQVSLEESLTSWIDADFLDNISFYVENGRISADQKTAVDDYLKCYQK